MRTLLRTLAPPTELLQRMRWALLIFPWIALAPWLVVVARGGANEASLVALALFVGVWVGWVGTYRQGKSSVLLELAHLPLAAALLLGQPDHEAALGPVGACLFALSMLLQAWGGPPWRFALRCLAVLGGMFTAAWLGGFSVLYPAFGIIAASLTVYLLAVALERQQQSLGRAHTLTSAASALTATSTPEAAARVVLDTALLLADHGIGAWLTVEVGGEAVVDQLSEATQPYIGPAHDLDIAQRGENGVLGTLYLKTAEPSDPDLRPALSTLLASAVQAVTRIALQRRQHELEIERRLQAVSTAGFGLQAPGFSKPESADPDRLAG